MDMNSRIEHLDSALCCVAHLGSSTCPALFVGLLED